MFKKWWLYIQSWFKSTSDDMMDPEIEIQVAIDQAKKKNQDLRNQDAGFVVSSVERFSRILWVFLSVRSVCIRVHPWLQSF